MSGITAPVSLWHELADKRCPPSHGRWIATQIPDVAAHFPADDDHTNIEEDTCPAAYAWIRSYPPVRITIRTVCSRRYDIVSGQRYVVYRQDCREVSQDDCRHG